MTEPERKPYYFSVRNDMISLVPAGTNRVLEIGAAGGLTGKELKAMGIAEVAGVEIMEEIARAGQQHYDALHIGDVETMDLPYDDGHFDCILYGDVLEHLRDPWALLVRHNRLVRQGGVIIVSIPNIRHYRIIKKLAFKGQWEYVDDGILDRTHLRFFTLGSLTDMVAGAGYEMVKVVKKASGAGWIKGLNSLSGGRFIDLLVRQYIVSARKIRGVS